MKEKIQNLKLGGWHRLWIVFAAMYLIIVAVFTASVFPKGLSDATPANVLKLMDQDKAQYIVDASRYKPYSSSSTSHTDYIETSNGHFLKIKLPTTNVRMPDGTIVSFPHDMPNDQIKNFIASKFPKEAAEAELGRIKRNVKKMADQNAPESDIDDYIESEGVTVEDIRNHIEKIRTKYPQYEDLSDRELTDRIYKKYYNDMPREEFGLKISNEDFTAYQEGRLQDVSTEGLLKLREMAMNNTKERKAFAEEIISEYEQNIPTALNKARLAAFGTGFFAWAIPVAVLYFFGWSAGWVYRGFKRNEKNSPS